MQSDQGLILSVNAGSSSIKFGLYEAAESLPLKLHGKVDRIGISGTKMSFSDYSLKRKEELSISAKTHLEAAGFLVDWLEERVGLGSILGAGHRLVHGMRHAEPEAVTGELLAELHLIEAYDPDHLPQELELIEVFRSRCPGLPQTACFDTAFHQTMPRTARQIPIPRRFGEMGIEKYGFHGISYAYLMEELQEVSGREAAMGRVLLAHLGNGASMAAVRDGRSMDTTMGFTPAAGLPMGSRTGDLDPGVAWYLLKKEGLSADQYNSLINHESGLLGISETSSDMRDLLDLQKKDSRAAEAVELFCYHARRWIGGFAAVLEGLDTIVFSGGIGENSPEIRARICRGLGFLGIELDDRQNSLNAPVISSARSPVSVRVIMTNEELMIARTVYRSLRKTDSTT